MSKHILVGDDLDREALGELPPQVRLASQLADSFHAQLDVVHAYEMPYFSSKTEALSAIEGPYIDQMQKVLSHYSVHGAVSIVKGKPAAALIEFAEGVQCEVIVLATHARKGLKYALLGSVAEDVIRHSVVPVLTVNPQYECKASRYRPKKILVALDFNQTTPMVFKTAIEFASRFSAEVILLTVVEEWVYPIVQSASLLAGGFVMPLERELQEVANLRYSQLRDLAKSAGSLETSVKLVERAPSIASAILEAADQTDADLIVMGHRSMGKVETALLGSVNRSVIREARCPVLTVH